MISEYVKEKIREAALDYCLNDPYPTGNSGFIAGAKFGYALASEENHSKRAHELGIRCANLEKSYRENYPATVKMAREPLEKENARLKEKLEKCKRGFEDIKYLVSDCLTPSNTIALAVDEVARLALKQIRDDKEMG